MSDDDFKEYIEGGGETFSVDSVCVVRDGGSKCIITPSRLFFISIDNGKLYEGSMDSDKYLVTDKLLIKYLYSRLVRYTEKANILAAQASLLRVELYNMIHERTIRSRH